jgi:hypothetical protein
MSPILCDNASLKSKNNKLYEKVDQPQGPTALRVGLQAYTEIADSTKAAPHRNPTRSYAAVAISGSSHSLSKEFA